MKTIRENQNNNAQKHRSSGIPTPKYHYITTFHVFLGEHDGMGAKLFKEPEYQEVCCELVSHKNCGLSNTGTMTVSMVKLMRKKKIYNHKQLMIIITRISLFHG